MGDITFSSDGEGFSREDLEETSRLSEEYFKTKKDESQVSTSPENRDWFYKNCQNYLNIIRGNGKIIGYSFVLPCNKKLMEDFLEKRINEAELFEEIKKLKFNGCPEAIYLFASLIDKNFRRRGLSITAFLRIINVVTHNLESKPILFCWGYSEEGLKLAKKIAKITGLGLSVREE